MTGCPLKWNNLLRAFDCESCMVVYFLRWLLRINLFIFFAFSHHLYMVGHWLSSSLSIGCMVSLSGDWAGFCNAGSGRVCKVWSARKKSLGILRRGWELNPGHREARQWAIPLSYQDCHYLYINRNIFYRLSKLEILNTIQYSWLLLPRE